MTNTVADTILAATKPKPRTNTRNLGKKLFFFSSLLYVLIFVGIVFAAIWLHSSFLGLMIMWLMVSPFLILFAGLVTAWVVGSFVQFWKWANK